MLKKQTNKADEERQKMEDEWNGERSGSSENYIKNENNWRLKKGGT